MTTYRHWAIEPSGEYPANWTEIADKAKREAGYICQHCGMAFGEDGKAWAHLNRDGQPSVLTVHHLDGNKADCSDKNLLVCCQACHLHIQALWSPGRELPAIWHEVPKWVIAKGLDYQPSRQLRLF